MKEAIGFMFMVLAGVLWGKMTDFYGIGTNITSILWQISMLASTIIGSILINNN